VVPVRGLWSAITKAGTVLHRRADNPNRREAKLERWRAEASEIAVYDARRSHRGRVPRVYEDDGARSFTWRSSFNLGNNAPSEPLYGLIFLDSCESRAPAGCLPKLRGTRRGGHLQYKSLLSQEEKGILAQRIFRCLSRDRCGRAILLEFMSECSQDPVFASLPYVAHTYLERYLTSGVNPGFGIPLWIADTNNGIAASGVRACDDNAWRKAYERRSRHALRSHDNISAATA
jgi:hypothetical protein